MGKLTHTVKSSIASFRSADKAPIESLKFHFLPKQASGTPSPENPILIEGWTGLNGKRAGKNIGHVMWSTTGGDADAVRKLSNSYGTSIDTLDFVNPDGRIVVTQTKWDNPSLVRSYMNGYVAPIVDTLERDEYYDISFKVTNIISNPLNASLSDMALSDPYGMGYVNPIVKDDIVIFRNYRHICKDTYPNRKHFELRTCGMSCTISELMVTPANSSDGVYEPYSGEQIPITFPMNGKNLFNKNDSSSIVTGLNVEKGSLSYYHFSGSSNATVVYIPCVPGATYTVSKVATTRSAVCYLKNNDLPENGKEVYGYLNFNNETSKTITVGSDATCLVVYITNLTYDSAPLQDVLDSLQIEYGDTATSYEPYSSDNTFYGGYIDPVAGEIVAEYGSYTFTGSQADNITYLNENTEAGITRHQFKTTVLDNIAKNSSSLYGYSNIASPNHWSLPRTNDLLFYIGTPTNQVSLYILSTECEATVESFNAWLSNHPWTIVYQLATPIHIPISSQDMKAFLDHNNFWSDANDDTEVEYWFSDRLALRKTSMNEPHLESKNASVASFETDMKANLKELKAYFTPVQEGTGDPSPINVRPIIGWTGLNGWKSGKNLLNTMDNSGYPNDTVSPGRIDTTNVGSGNSNHIKFNQIFKKGTYTISGKYSGTGVGGIRLLCSSQIENSVWNQYYDAYFIDYLQYNKHTFTLEEDSTLGVVFLIKSGHSFESGSIYDLQVEKGSIATEYEPYSGETIPIEFPATRNLLDTSTHEDNTHIVKKGVTFDYNSDGSLTVNGSVEVGATQGPQYRMALWTQQETGNFYLCCLAPYSTTYNETYVYDSDLQERPKKWDEETSSQSAGSNRPLAEVHLIAGHTYAVNVRINRETGQTYSNNKFYVMLLQSTDTDTHYESYATVYGGYVDVVKGKLVAEWLSFNLKTLNWGNYSGNKLFYANVHKDKNTLGYSSHFPINENQNPTEDMHIGFYSNGAGYANAVYFYKTGMTNTTDFKTWLNSLDYDPIIVIKSDTPIEYDLTPQQLKAFKGINNIWSDLNGNVEVKYWTH